MQDLGQEIRIIDKNSHNHGPTCGSSFFGIG
jgi:hypothetical protein